MGWRILAAPKGTFPCWDLATQNKYCLMIACDIAGHTNALCFEQGGHLWPQLMQKGFEVDPDERAGLRFQSRRGIFLQFRLINVASGQVTSPTMLYITFQFKCPLYPVSSVPPIALCLLE